MSEDLRPRRTPIKKDEAADVGSSAHVEVDPVTTLLCRCPDPPRRQGKWTCQRKEASSMSIAQTHHGYTLDVVRSALQKAIRRGQEDEAAWWAFQLLKYGWFKYLWRTFRGIAAEDIGMGDPDIATKIDAMANNAMESTDGGKKGAFVGLWEMTAVITLCRAPKSWEQTHLLLKQQKLWQDIEHGRTEPPPPKEEALDAHTDAGRRNGVKKSQWWNEGDALEPKAPGHYHHGTDPHASIHGDPEIA